jgi:hypothetical protein
MFKKLIDSQEAVEIFMDEDCVSLCQGESPEENIIIISYENIRKFSDNLSAFIDSKGL